MGECKDFMDLKYLQARIIWSTMGNVVSYFLAKPEAAAVERGNAEDKGKKIEEAGR